MPRIGHGERVRLAIRVVRIRAQRKQRSNRLDDSGRRHDCLTAKLSSVVPSLPGACKSGTFFAAARIASESFFTIPCATANRGGCWPKSHLPESSSAWNWRRCRSPFSSEMKPTTKSEITPPMPIRTTMAVTPIADFNPVRPFTLSSQMNTDRTQITSLVTL